MVSKRRYRDAISDMTLYCLKVKKQRDELLKTMKVIHELTQQWCGDHVEMAEQLGAIRENAYKAIADAEAK